MSEYNDRTETGVRNSTRRHHRPLSGQADEEQSETRHIDQRLAAGRQTFVIFAQAT